MKKEILISVIVPVYNVENELHRCVDSIIHQTYSNIEILLVDDGSTDSSPEICNHYMELDNRVSVIHKANGGLSSARNTGLRASKGDYVSYVDSDDYLEVDAYENFLHCIADDVDMVVGVLKEIRKEQIYIQKRSLLSSGVAYEAKEFIISSIKANEFYAPAVLNLTRRDFLIDNNLFFKEGIFFEDHEMLPRLYLSARRIGYMDIPFYNYVIRDGSIMTTSNTEEKTQMSLEIWKGWFDLISSVQDEELQKYMYGILVKYYLRNSRVRKIKGWLIPGMNFKFAMKYSLDFKERLKAIVFTIAPNIYTMKE